MLRCTCSIQTPTLQLLFRRKQQGTIICRSSGSSLQKADEPRRPPNVLLIDDLRSQRLNQLYSVIASAIKFSIYKKDRIRIALDCQGDNLGRYGSIETAALYFERPVKHSPILFLIEIGESKGPSSQLAHRLIALRHILECKYIEKVLHNSFEASDALFHHHKIAVNNVYDTHCYQSVIDGKENATPVSRKRILQSSGLLESDEEALARSKTESDESSFPPPSPPPSTGTASPPYSWSRRPMTEEMIWEATDYLDLLLELSNQQKAKLDKGQRKTAKGLSSRVAKLRHLPHYKPVLCKVPLDDLNVNKVQEQTGARLLLRSDSTFLVFYANETQLNAAERILSGAAANDRVIENDL